MPNPTRPIIFLDVDGVVNWHLDSVEPDMVRRLGRVCQVTKADIVVSSVKRDEENFMDLFKEMLEEVGVRIVGVTPQRQCNWPSPKDPKTNGDWVRAQEIRHWLRENRPDGVAWVAIDDDTLALPVEHFVKCFCQTGMTEQHAGELVWKILQQQQELDAIAQRREETPLNPQDIPVRGIYRHRNGNLYEVTSVPTHTETGEKFVHYRALYGDFEPWIRPLEMFMSSGRFQLVKEF